MAYSNYRSDWGRDRDERWRSGRDWDEDDSRRARESMERDYYGNEGSGRGGWRGQEGQGQRYNRGYGQGDYDQEYGQRESGQGARYSQSGRLSQSGYGRGREYLGGERHHYGNEMGGWQGREEEQWRNRDVHGQYDRDANYGGFSSSGTGNYRGYGGGSHQGGRGRWGEAGTQYGQGGSQGDYNYRGYERGRERHGQQRYDQGHDDRYGQGDYGRQQSRGPGRSERPSGARAYGGDYSGSPSGYFGDEYISPGQGLDQWGTHQDYGTHRGRGPRGYKRSDERIREEVCDCLTDDDRLDATNIEVTVKDGEVTLSGYTASREDKRWAESLAERISGVKEVQNSIRLQDQQRAQTGTQSSTQGSSSRGGDKGRESNVQH